MSVQKSSSKRISLNKVDVVTKNKIIDSLIKNKLSQQKPIIKQALNKITSRQPNQIQNYQKSFQIKKKRSSSLKTISISMSRIKESLSFNPLIQIPKNISQVQNFIIQRQRSSPLLQQSYIEKNADHRLNCKSYQVKFQNLDKLVYFTTDQKQFTSINDRNNSQKQIQFYLTQLQAKAKKNIQKQLWVTNQPYFENIFQQLNQDKHLRNLIFEIQPVKIQQLNSVAKHQSLVPLKSNKNKKYQNKQQIIYDYKKYHKQDFQSLQSWFQKNIKLAKQNLNALNYKDKFNKIYALYICSFQQIIRLTYVQSYQKGIILQKFLWSFIRLFCRLIEQQHKINYADFQYFNNQNKEMKNMYEDRCSKLQKMMLLAQAEAKSTIQIRSKLSKAYLAYSRVNRVLFQELQQKNQKLKEIQSENNLIKLKFFKLIQALQQKQFIKTTVDQHYTSYFYFYQNKAQTLIQIPIKPKIANKLNNAIFNYNQINQQLIELNHDSSVAKKIRKVQNQLNKYWLKKQEDLHIKSLIDNQLIDYQIKSIQTQTEQIKFQDYEVQFPEENQQNSFAQFLKSQLLDERKSFQKQMQNQNDLYISLKELYQQSYQQIAVLNQNNKKLRIQLQKNKILIEKLQKQNTLNFKQNHQLSQKLKEHQNIINNKNNQIQYYKQKLSNFQKEFENVNHKLNLQLQNSKNLIRNSLQHKQKVSILQLKLKQTNQKQKQLMENINRLEVLQRQFIAIDKRLQKLGPTLQKFLQYQKFDNDSIIKKTKEQVQMLLDKYVCKDSALFLTKSD